MHFIIKGQSQRLGLEVQSMKNFVSLKKKKNTYTYRTHTLTQRLTHTHTLARESACLFFCTHGKMKTSVRVRLKFISVCQARAKSDLTAHYFDKFGARDREEMEERGRKAPHAPHTR